MPGAASQGTAEGPDALRRRGLPSPVLTRSPELSGSAPSGRPVGPTVAARLPQKISPRGGPSILESGHSNEGCCARDASFRIEVRYPAVN